MQWVAKRLLCFASSACIALLPYSSLGLICSSCSGQENPSESQRQESDSRASRSRGDDGRGSEESQKPKRKIFSGPQAGEKIGEFPLWQLAGGDEPSEKTDLKQLAAKRPLAIAIMHQRTRPAYAVARLMAAYGDRLEKDKLEFCFVMLSEDRSETEQWMRKTVRRYFAKTKTMGVADGGLEGPGNLGLNRLAQMTILLVKGDKVTANFALTQPSAGTDGPKIIKAMAELAGEKEPPKLSELMPQNARRMNQTRRAP
ncbi:MAG TPA: hypothetical protein DDW52_26290, partial [Planctomycetaceae bacterium]|nr:hypothetical protein [Planctomycetaceae bacterium]